MFLFESLFELLWQLGPGVFCLCSSIVTFSWFCSSRTDSNL